MRGQFFIMAAIVLMFNLILINQFLSMSQPPETSQHTEEINYARNLEANLRSLEGSPKFLLERNLDMFTLASAKASSRGFSVLIQCCKNSYCQKECSQLDFVNLTNMTIKVDIASESFELHSELPFR